MEKSFFEYLGIADMERIHSQFISWIFSDHFNGISKKDKLNILIDLFKLKLNSDDNIRIHTEKKNIDILIETTDNVVIIENKLKSSEHSNQLKKYHDYCSKEYPNLGQSFFFLTLIDEKAKSPWVNLSYSKLLNTFHDIDILDNKHGVIFKEYILYLDNLISTISDFKINYKNYDRVFLDGSVKKEDKIFDNYRSPKERFIAENQLETILQKYYLQLVVNKIKGAISHHIGETRGNALIDLRIRENIEYGQHKYATAIQFQGGTVKFIFAVQSDYNKSEKEWIENVILKMEELMSPKNGYIKLNKPSSKAYVSISKKIGNKKYWNMSVDELANLLSQEIILGKKLTSQLLTKIK